MDKNTNGFNWNRGRPLHNGAHTTTFPRTYSMILEAFGEQLASEFLSLCERKESLLDVVIYIETPAATKFRKSLDW